MVALRTWTAGVLVVLAASSAEAGNGSSRDPSFTIEANRLILNMGVVLSGRPSCNTSDQFVADLRTEAGKSFLDTLNAAKRSRLAVRADGTNSCTLAPNAENLRSLKLWGVPFQ